VVWIYYIIWCISLFFNGRRKLNDFLKNFVFLMESFFIIIITTDSYYSNKSFGMITKNQRPDTFDASLVCNIVFRVLP
jgi:hypothetical protein